MSDLRKVPSVDALSRSTALAGFPERVRVVAARQAAQRLRDRVRAGEPVDNPEGLAVEIAKSLSTPSLTPAINLSGVILHTGLGRARLAEDAQRALRDVTAGHAAVELDLGSGQRGDRQEHVRDLLVELTGAEDALVVNNAAAAVFLTLNALAVGRGVLLSRGQMVEIGGSFRMPDIVRQSGCQLVEVGCTNKTRLSDFEGAIDETTGAILRCHPSNFKIIGFTEEPSLETLAALARERGILIIDDQGTGCLVDSTQYGLPFMATLPGSIAGGADVAMASGDKMLGGPQAGLIVGKRELIAQIKRHPLARAVRVDKLTLAALEATLRLYRDGRENEIPTLSYLKRTLGEVEALALEIQKACGKHGIVEPGITEVGGGSAPGTGVPTVRVGIQSSAPDDLARRLRANRPAILGRIERDRVWLDPRTLDESELPAVVDALRTILT